MRGWIFVFWLACCNAALAAGYDDYSLAMDAFLHGGQEYFAIAEFTKALNAGDLNPGLIPVAYLNRGSARLNKHDCADAASDAAASLKAKPGYLDALLLQLKAHTCLSQYDLALADSNEIVAAQPKNWAYWARAEVWWAKGNFAAAADDYETAIKLNSKFEYVALWAAMMRARAGDAQNQRAMVELRSMEPSDWPAPVFDLYLGKIKPDDVMAAAAKGSADDVTNHQCEANFYVAEYWLARGQTGTAKPLLEKAKANCPKTFYEFDFSEDELKNLH
ncbi:MAG: hypothetical protein ACTHLR_15770 [Rhizomicrobium sp.]